MSIKDFKVTQGLEVDSYEIDVSGAVEGQTLVYDGSVYRPADIVPVGTIEMWAGSFTPPDGWLLCDGTSYQWSDYTRLRDVIGTSYGGSINTSWSVPNLTTSTNPVTPVGVAAGGSLGTDSRLADSASTAHTHDYSNTSLVSTTDGYGQHSHSTGNANMHTHTLANNNWNHFHNSNTPSATHAHSYLRGNISSQATAGAAHTTHNVGNASHAHEHNLASTSAQAQHDHAYETALGEHSHNWNLGNTVSTSSGANHNHTVNKQSIYFIIKF